MSAQDVRHSEIFQRYADPDPSGDEFFARITRLAVHSLGLSIAIISLVSQTQTRVKAAYCAASLSLEDADPLLQTLFNFSQQVARSDRRLVMQPELGVGTGQVTDVRNADDDETALYVGVPLKAADGQVMGVFCMANPSFQPLEVDQIALLTDLAAIVLDKIEALQAAERIQALESVCQQSQQELHALSEAIDGAVWVLDAQGRYLKITASPPQLHKPTAAAIGQTLHQVFEPAQADLFLGLVEYALTTRQTVRTEYSLPDADQELWFAATITPLSDQTVLWVARDISDREQTATVLADSAAQIHLIIDSVPARIAYVDNQQCYRFVNRQYEEWFQMPATEIIGKHLRELLGDEIYQRSQVSVEAALAGEQVTHQDTLRSPEGIEHDFEVTYVPNISNHGEVLGFYVFAQDITDRKRAEEILRQSEAEFRALFAAMSDAIFVVDAQGRYLKIAPTSPDLHYRPATELIGKTVHEVFPPERAEACLQLVHQALSSNQTVQTEYSLSIGDRERWFSTTVSPLSSDSVIVVARDMTDLKQAEIQLNRAMEEREVLLRQLDS